MQRWKIQIISGSGHLSLLLDSVFLVGPLVPVQGIFAGERSIA